MPGSSAPLSTTRLNGRAHRTASAALDFVQESAKYRGEPLRDMMLYATLSA
jgi:hypothetical protein